jgi:dihydrofolate reductase
MNLIVAVDLNWGIGKNGTQTVVIPEDRKHFRTLTDGSTVIVGRRTLEDFPGKKPLAGRRNIVMSRNSDLTIEGATVVATLDELFSEIAGTNPDNVFLIGGDSLFKLLYRYCKYAYVTKIIASPESDTFFPNLDIDPGWVVETKGKTKNYKGIEYAFMRYENLSPLAYEAGRSQIDRG